MRHAFRPWKTFGLLVGGLCLEVLSITPIMAAPVTYTFTGVVTESDSALTPLLPFSTPIPLSRVSRSKNGFITQLVGSKRYTTNSTSPIQVNIGTYQVHLPFSARDQRGELSFSKATHLSSAKEGLTLTPSSSVTSWLSHDSFGNLGESPSDFGTAAFAKPLELPPSIGALSYSGQSRLPFNSETAPPSPATIAQGTITPATAGPLPASLIIAGVGLVALIGLGAGGLRQS